MKILVIAPYAVHTPHFETDLEITQNHLDQGDQLILLRCNAELLTCSVNRGHDIATCLTCLAKRSAGMKLLSGRIIEKPMYFLRKENREEIARVKKDFSSLEDLKYFKIENYDIGSEILSSLISCTRNPEPDLGKYKDEIARNLLSCLAVYRSIQNYLNYYNPDKVYVFNGRFAPLRAALRACQNQGIEILVHERGNNLNFYSLYKNTTPHDISYINKEIEKAWESNRDHSDRNKIASDFFIDKRKGIEKSWFSFTREQIKDLLPPNLDGNKINIMIYNSSEDEFAAIGDEWKNPIFVDQHDEIANIVHFMMGNKNVHVYLRIHPNLKNVRYKQLDKIYSLHAPNFTIIPPESPISSYALLEKASKVVTFGSTVGVEAAYWGIPSILAGQSYYRNLGCTYNPNSHEELIEMLLTDLPPKDKEGALKYGYFFNTFGIRFQHFEPDGLFSGSFKGTVLNENPLSRLIIIMLRIAFPLNKFFGKISMYFNIYKIKPFHS